MLDIKRILGKIRRATEDYNMLQDGDRIAVGISGGKDSLALLYELKKYQRFCPVQFDIEAVTVDIGAGESNFASIKSLCSSMGVSYTIEKTDIKQIVFNIRKERNPCSMCANLRRGALNNAAVRLGCNKVALGHNRDDVIETLMLSIIYEGRIHTFSPVTCLDRKQIYVIRPLIYVEEKEIKKFIKEKKLVTISSQCGIAGVTKREKIKQLILDLYKENSEIKSNIFGAIKRSGIDGW